MAPSSVKEHFALKQLSPIHDDPILFVVSQWQPNKSQSHILYLIYRTILAAFLIATWGLTFTYDSEGIRYWLIFLTYWGYVLCVLQAFLAFLMVTSSFVVSRFFENPKAHVHVLKMHSVYWITHSIATSIGFVITFIFWIMIWDAYSIFTAINFYVLGSNSIVLLLDLLLVAQPVRILHCVYPLLFGLAYLIFSVVYYFYDTNRGGSGLIYPVLDWSAPGSNAWIVFGTIFLILCFHLLSFAIYKLKLLIHDRIYPETVRPTANQTQSTEELSRAV